MPDRSATVWVRPASLVVLLGGFIIGAVDVIRGLQTSGDQRVPLVLHGAAVTLAFIALAAIVFGVAMLLEHQYISDSKSSDSNSPILQTLSQIHQALDQLPSSLSSLMVVNAEERSAHQPSPTSAIPSDLTRAMEQMAALLEEIRDASMLDESQRQARQKTLAEHRKAATIADAASAIQGRQWARADKLISALEADFPGEASVQDLHRKLRDGRASQEGEAVEKIRSRVEDLMSISSWDEAYQMALQFAENFPDNSEGAGLLARVTRERDLFNESTVHQLYEEIKADLERRRWRRALAGAQRLLERFPDNRKTAKIRAQIKTIQDNAEIEERQEQEQRIQELIRSKRFAEAIELAEDLLDRFPLSPQAESLEELLPKMRDLAMHQDFAAEAAAQQR